MGWRLRSVLVGLVVVAGCAGPAGSAEGEDGVRDVVTEAFVSLADGDSEAFCGLLTDNGIQDFVELAGAYEYSCPRVFDTMAAPFDEAGREAMRSLTVERVSVDGDIATVADADLVADVHPWPTDLSPQPMRLVRQDDRWLIDAFNSPRD